jgi:GNAT superfamily N-acetyltransferase
VRLRAATRDDVPALAALVLECDLSHRYWAGPALPVPELAEQALEWDLHFARRGAWTTVAVERGAIVGVVAYGPDRDGTPDLAHVNAVFVHPARWRRGIARRLLDAAEAAMVAEGYARAQLWTLAGSPAEDLYAALGWARDGRNDHHAGMGHDLVGYAKALAPQPVALTRR